MSWSTNHTGSKEKVAAAVTSDLDASAKSYEGHEEQKDVLAAKERILSAIADMNTETVPGMSGVGGVRVIASGSRSRYSCTVNVDVQRVMLDV